MGVLEQRALQALDDLRDWDLERIPHRALLREAWGFRLNVSAHDALYLAAARLQDADVLTADGPLSRAPSMGVLVQNARQL